MQEDMTLTIYNQEAHHATDFEGDIPIDVPQFNTTDNEQQIIVLPVGPSVVTLGYMELSTTQKVVAESLKIPPSTLAKRFSLACSRKWPSRQVRSYVNKLKTMVMGPCDGTKLNSKQIQKIVDITRDVQILTQEVNVILK